MFLELSKSRPEVADDVMFIVLVDSVGMDVLVKFGGFTLNRGLIIRLVLVGPVFCTYTQYSYAVCSRPQAPGHVISSMCM